MVDGREGGGFFRKPQSSQGKVSCQEQGKRPVGEGRQNGHISETPESKGVDESSDEAKQETGEGSYLRGDRGVEPRFFGKKRLF